ncbi:MAG: ATP-binding protein [Balneolales bacterium]|nr:ATP-binding protein [Balneolales bacterium]
MIARTLTERIKKTMTGGKAVIVLGARQTGKTTLLHSIVENQPGMLHLNCDEPIARRQLQDVNLAELRKVIGDKKLIFIDEAQRVRNIGLTLKLIIDNFRGIQLLASGSSALDLASEFKESLAGRKRDYHLYPLSWRELADHEGYLQAKAQLQNRIVYGMYPEVITSPGEEDELLYELTDSYLYKDLLSFEGIRKPDILTKLVQALALQIGSEVSYNELAQVVGADKNTISSYIDLLEKTFVVFRLPAYSTNARNELSRKRKVFFYDTGVRNAVIGNFSPLEMRTDTGALWENFLISERMKMLGNNRIRAGMYFWRSINQTEVDYVEKRGQKLLAFEFKWNPKAKKKKPRAFLNNYEADFDFIDRDNFTDFLY